MYQKEISNKNEKSQHPLCMQISPLKYKKMRPWESYFNKQINKRSASLIFVTGVLCLKAELPLKYLLGRAVIAGWAVRELCRHKGGTGNIHDMGDIPPKEKLGEGKGH